MFVLNLWLQSDTLTFNALDLVTCRLKCTYHRIKTHALPSQKKSPGLPRRIIPTNDWVCGECVIILPKTVMETFKAFHVGCVSPALKRRGALYMGSPQLRLPDRDPWDRYPPDRDTSDRDPLWQTPPGTRDQRLCLRVVITHIGPLDPPMLLDRIYLLPLT